MQEPLKAFRSKILRKPLAVILLIYFFITAFLVILGAIYYAYQKDKITDERLEYLSSVSDFRNSQIEDWLKERFAQLEVLRANVPLVQKLEVIGKSPERFEGLVEWTGSLKKYYKYDEIALADFSTGRLSAIVPSGRQFNEIDSALSGKAIETNSIYFSDTAEKYFAGIPIKFYVPLSDPLRLSTSVNKILILTADPRNVFGNILNRNIEKSSSLESLLVKPYEKGIIYLNRLDTSGDEADQLSGRKALIEANTIKSRPGFVDGVDYKNNEVIAVIQPVRSAAWSLITKINKSELYAPLHYMARLVFLVGFSADLFFALVLFFFWRKSIVENYKKIYAAEVEKLQLENRFESLVNGVKDIAIFIIDKEGKIISWNEGAEIIDGYSSQEIMGMNFSVLYPADEAENKKPEENLSIAAEQGSFNEEGWRKRKDGSLYWANVSITALKDEKQNVYGFLKIVRDLTEKRKTEEEIKKSRDFYLKLLDDFPTPVWRSDIDGQCDYFNKAWLSFTGRKFEEEKGEGWAQNLHPDDKSRVLKEFYEAFRHKRNFTLEYRLKNSRDEYRWLLDFGMPYYDIDNSFAGYLGSCFDIDDRKKYEDTINALMRMSEKLYSSLEINQILDSLVADSIDIADADGGYACILSENGYAVKRYFNEDHWEYFEKTLTADHALIKRFENSREPVLIDEAKNIYGDDPGWLKKYSVKQILATPLYGTGGELLGYFEIHIKKKNFVINNESILVLRSVARNASVAIAKSMNYEQLRKTEAQLRNSESELRNLAAQIQYGREEERQRIAREVHDELGQLFTGINLNISLLTEMLEQEQKISVREIIDELHSVQQFVDQGIKTVRDISSSLRSYVLDHLGLVPAIQEYCLQIERLSGLKCNFNSELDTFNFNDERNVAVFRIIQEAITNVLRHAEASAIDISMKSSGKNLEITVADNGKGFSQAKPLRHNSMGILGMKERAVFLGGKLNLESSEDRGTKIKLHVPFS